MPNLTKLCQTVLSSTSIYLLHVEKYKKKYNNNKLKIAAPSWNDEFELPDGSYSVLDIQ